MFFVNKKKDYIYYKDWIGTKNNHCLLEMSKVEILVLNVTWKTHNCCLLEIQKSGFSYCLKDVYDLINGWCK